MRKNADICAKRSKDIAAHEEEIDAMINEHTTGWKTGRMNKVDLSVLRLAVYGDEVG